MKPSKLFLLLAFAAVAAAAFASPGGASVGPCNPGHHRPLCHWKKARVTFVADGDTLDAHLLGTHRTIRVRMTGINAMEQSVYASDPSKRRGECHSLAATARLEQLVRRSRWIVKLSSQGRDPRSGSHRHRRWIAARVHGHWRDVGQILISEGHVLFLANGHEWAHNRAYMKAAQRAARRHLRLWNPTYCGQDATDADQLRMWVNWDAEGNDRRNPNGEWAKVKNLGSVPIPLHGWFFRDSWVKRYHFPSSAVLAPGSMMTIYIGRRPSWDSNYTTHFYWGLSSPPFDNVRRARGVGDGGYLFDGNGNLRSYMMYPCRVACGDPLKHKVRIYAHPKRPELVVVKNRTSRRVNIGGYVIESEPYIYWVSPHTIIPGGARLKLFVRGASSRSSGLRRYWGLPKYILNDGGDSVEIRTETDVVISCYRWGRSHC